MSGWRRWIRWIEFRSMISMQLGTHLAFSNQPESVTRMKRVGRASFRLVALLAITILTATSSVAWRWGGRMHCVLHGRLDHV